MLMRLNLDKVTHTIHCHYPASGRKYFKRLRFGTIYHENIRVVEHPVSEAGIVYNDGKFTIEAVFLKHSIENIGWRVTEADVRKFDDQKLKAFGVQGRVVRDLQEKGVLEIDGKKVTLDDVSRIKKGDSLAMVIDTLPCPEAIEIAKNAKVLICESTYLEEHRDLAEGHYHLTARQAAEIAKKANAHQLILTHFSARYPNPKDFENEAKEIFSNTIAAEDLKVIQFPK